MRHLEPNSPDLHRLDDAQLLRRACAGDANAFTLVHDRHARAALNAAQRILGMTPAAEDVVQEAFVQLWKSGDRFAPERGSLRAWLLVVVRSRALDSLRREKVRTETAGRVLAAVRDEPQVAADAELTRREQAREVRHCLTSLPPEQGQVIGMLYLAGRTQAEIAGDLNVPLGTVKGRTRLALTKLRTQLREHSAA